MGRKVARKMMKLFMGGVFLYSCFVSCSVEAVTSTQCDVNVVYNRNAVELIEDIHVSFLHELTSLEKRDVVQSIVFSPDFNYTYVWQDNILIITPVEVLRELTEYKLEIGNSPIKHHAALLTGPYLYNTADAIIPPSHWYTYPQYRVNADLMVEVDYGENGWQKNFVTSAQFALACYDDYILTGKKESREIFFKQIEYFISDYHDIDGAAAYPYLFPFRTLNPPWYCGMAQGQIVSCLVRAFVLTGDDYYLEFAEKVVKFMFKNVRDGGVFTYTPEGYEWIEEYPTKPASYVLNGFMFALMGLLDYQKVSPTIDIGNHIQELITTLKSTVEVYDTGNGLYYERNSPNICDNIYHGIQVYQMKHLYKSTGDTFFDSLFAKWFSYFDYDAFMSVYE